MSKTRYIAAFAVLLTFWYALSAKAGLVTDPYSAVTGATILASQLNQRFTTLYTLVNGNIDNANIKAGANIDPSKLNLTSTVFAVTRSPSTSPSFSSSVTGDSNPRWQADAAGFLKFGPGVSALDTMLKRVGAAILAIRDAGDTADGALQLGDLRLNGNVVSDTLAQGIIPGGRLTLTSGTSVTTTDVTAATNVYYTPDQHNLLPQYSATDGKVVLRPFSEMTLSIAGYAANTNFDVFSKYSGGTITLSTQAWSGDTTRATALTQLANSKLLVSSSDNEKTFLGTFRTTSTIGQTEDSAARRHVCNVYNKVARAMAATDPTDTWTYTTALVREANGASTDGISRFAFVRALDNDAVTVAALHLARNGTTNVQVGAGIGIDSSAAFVTTGIHTNITTAQANGYLPLPASYTGNPGIGYHTARLLEYSTATNTTTWMGDNGVVGYTRSGLTGSMLM